MKTRPLSLDELIKLPPDDIYKIIFDYDGAFGTTDFSHTILRLWQVFSALYEQGTIDSNDNPNSTFNRALHGGLPPADYTPQYAIEWALGLGVIIPLLIGGLGKYRHFKNDREVASLKYQLMQKGNIQRPVKPLQKEARPPEESLLQEFHYFASKNKITLHAAAPKAIIKKPSLLLQIGSRAQAIWNELLNFSTIFWPVWMSTMLLVGSTAIGAAPVMPIMMGVVFSLSAVYMGYFIWTRSTRATTVPDESVVNSNLNGFKEIWQRRHMKEAHLAFKQSLRPIINAFDKDSSQTPQYQPLFNNDTFENLPDLNAKEKNAHLKNPPQKPKNITPQYIYRMKQDELLRYLFGSQRKQRLHTAITVTMNFIGQLAGTFFVLWFLASSLSAIGFLLPVGHLAIPILNSISNVIGGNIFGSALGSFIGLITSYQVYQRHQAAKLAFHNDVINTLSSAYSAKKPADIMKVLGNRHHKEVLDQFRKHATQHNTKFDRFKTLQTAISYYKNLLKSTQDNLRKLPNHRLSPLETMQLAYDINKVDVLNRDYYFAKQKESTRQTWLMKGVMRLYNGLYGAQTGFFISRMFFLTGGVAASACLAYGSGALIAFAVVAGILAATVGSLRTARYHLDRDQHYKLSFIQSFDAKLSYMSKKFKEMYYLFPEKMEKINDYSSDESFSDDESQPLLPGPRVNTGLASITNVTAFKPKSLSTDTVVLKPRIT
jgi:hypothetical protein